MQKNDSFNSVLSKDPTELLYWLIETFNTDIPTTIASSDDMKAASETLLNLSGTYSYLMALLSYAKIQTRETKRNKSKELYEDMVDRKEVIQNFTDVVKQNYSAVSRAVTIYIENNNELKMARGTI